MWINSSVELAVGAVVSVAFLAGQIHVFLYHLVHLNAELLVHLVADDLGVDEEGDQEDCGHHQQDYQDCLPEACGSINVVLLVVLFDKVDAFVWGINEGVADGLEDLWGFEEPVEVAAVDGDLGVEEDAQFPWLSVDLFQDIGLFIGYFPQSALGLGLHFIDDPCWYRYVTHDGVGAIGDIFFLNANFIIKFGHVFPPEFILNVLLAADLIPEVVLPDLLVDQVHSLGIGDIRIVRFFYIPAEFVSPNHCNAIIFATDPVITGVLQSETVLASTIPYF